MRRRDEDGAAAVEFAIVLIPLMLILFGIISYAYMFSVRQALTQAAAEGARAAAVAPPGDSQARGTAAVEKALGGYGDLDCGGAVACTVSSPAPCGSAQCVTVTVKLDYESYDPFNLPLVPMPKTLQFTSSAEVN